MGENVSLVNGHIDGTNTCVICGREIPEGNQVCVICGKVPSKLQTNYDRIRNMSVEEMAKLLAQRNFSCMRFCKNCESCNQNTFCYPFCIDGIKKWLESEVTK